MKQYDEEKLVRRCGRGDRQAYGVLVDRYARIVFGLCLSTLDITPAGVLTRLCRARQYMRTLLIQEPDHE